MGLQVLYFVQIDGMDNSVRGFPREKHDIGSENCIFQIVLVGDGLMIAKFVD